MRARTLTSAAVATLLLAAPVDVAFAQNAQPPADCVKWEECRQLAIDARAEDHYGRFLDFAWRAVQRGPANDVDLMYLLARAQALGGRSSDALVTLGRLAERGAGDAALTDPDFDRARRTAAWPGVEAALREIAEARAPQPAQSTPAASAVSVPAAPVPAAPPPALPPPAPPPAAPPPPAATPPPTAAPAAAPSAAASAPVPVEAAKPAAPPPKPAAPAVSAATAPAVSPAPAVVTPPAAVVPPVSRLKLDLQPSEEVSRFSTAPFNASAMAYDAVSRRFLFGDVEGRRVIVVGEGSARVDNLVLAATAQFNDVTAFEIDRTRGDLWVASTAPNGYVGAIHRLQLISGRAVAMIESPSEFERVRLIDLVVASNGALLILDGAAPRVIGYRPGAKELEERMALEVDAPTSIATAGDDRIVYVAHRTGIVRVDLQQRTAAPVTAPEDVDLGGFDRIRWHGGGLVGVQRLPDGSRRIVQMPLARGRVVSGATVIETGLSGGAGPVLTTVTADDLYYLVTEEAESPTAPGDRVLNVVVRRMHLPAAGSP